MDHTFHDKEDIRLSYFLEDAATEFDVQGLELDWTCNVWDADLRLTEFRG
ncbi:DNA/RNA helicase domain-containing protein [Paenibacillus forsythiae]